MIRKVVHSVLTFLIKKNAPRGCDQMHAEYDCLWQSASGAQSGTSHLRIEGLREFEADLSALFEKCVNCTKNN